MGQLDGKVAIISGGARGMGAAEGRLFTEEGATVFLTDVLADEGKKAAAEFGAVFLDHDVTSEEQWAAVVGEVQRQAGRIDVLVNNAGILRWMTMTETPLDVWDQMIAVNQTGVFLGMKAVAPVMMEQRSGSIINISSVGGLRGASSCFAYGATKWAVRGMTKGAAQELGPHGIRVNSIHPGLVDTPMMEGFPLGDMANDRVPLRRPASPDDVARQALWLASDASSYSSGGEFLVDGGMMA